MKAFTGRTQGQGTGRNAGGRAGPGSEHAGGPDHASEVVPVFIYHQALDSGQLGYASAISLLLLVVNLAIALVYMRLLRRRA